MARNEEKQLARLNRFYLQQQKDEELKKKPPRPKLDTLHTVDEVKKWLPSIMNDIDFYVKQMEVSCYPERTIEEFSRRLDGLRGEYKAYVNRLRVLEPELDCTPWTDRPYKAKKSKRIKEYDQVQEPASDPNKKTTFVPISVPVLKNDKIYEKCFGYEKLKEPSLTANVNEETQDQPLLFNFNSSSMKALEYDSQCLQTDNCPDSNCRGRIEEKLIESLCAEQNFMTDNVANNVADNNSFLKSNKWDNQNEPLDLDFKSKSLETSPSFCHKEFRDPKIDTGNQEKSDKVRLKDSAKPDVTSLIPYSDSSSSGDEDD